MATMNPAALNRLLDSRFFLSSILIVTSIDLILVEQNAGGVVYFVVLEVWRVLCMDAEGLEENKTFDPRHRGQPGCRYVGVPAGLLDRGGKHRVLLQVPVGQVDDGCIRLQIFSSNDPHIQILRKTVGSRDQVAEGCIREYNRRDEDDDTDERENSHNNQMSVEFRFHAIIPVLKSAGRQAPAKTPRRRGPQRTCSPAASYTAHGQTASRIRSRYARHG